MLFNSDKNQNIKSSSSDISQFHVKADEKLFMLLSDSIYADKIAACIRELSCNAYDAHVESQVKKPFIVHLPTEEEPEFFVRDFGAGLTKDQMSMYTTYGDSTKTGSNAYVGAFGIGAKSPFAYTNMLSVSSFQSGKVRHYSMAIDKGLPKMTFLGEFDTEEASGLKVSFVVNNADFYQFQTKAAEILALMDGEVLVQNTSSWFDDLYYDSLIDWADAPYLGSGFYESKLELTDHSFSEMYIVQGNVKYSISQDELREAFNQYADDEGFFYKVKKSLSRDLRFKGFFKVPNGTFMPQPSRERLSFTPDTKKKLGAILKTIYKNKVTDRVEHHLREAKDSYIALHRSLKNENSVICEIEDIQGYTVDRYGASFKDWLYTSIEGVRMFNVGSSLTVRTLQNHQIRHILNLNCCIFIRGDKEPLTAERKCKMCQYLEDHKDSLPSPTRAIVLNHGHLRMFSSADQLLMVPIKDLPNATESVKTTYLSNRLSSVAGSEVTVIELSNVDEVEVYRLQSRFFDDLSETDRKSLFFIESTKAWVTNFNGHTFNLKLNKGKKDFQRAYKFVIESFRNRLFKTDPYVSRRERIVLLPPKHPLLASLKSFNSMLEDQIRFLVSSFEKSAKFYWWNSLADEWKPLLEGLCESGLISELPELHSVKDKYMDWYLSGRKTCSGHMDFAEIDFDYYQLPQELKDTVHSIKDKLAQDYYALTPAIEIVNALQESYPLVQALRCLPFRLMHKACTDIMEYLAAKQSKDHFKEVE